MQRWAQRLYQHPYIIGCLVSLAISAVVLCYQQPVNLDAFTYLKAAHVYLQQGYLASYKAYSWPTYPIMVAWLHNITGLSVLNSAYLLNTLFAVVLVVGFSRLVADIYQRQAFAWLGLLVISHFQYYNHLRDDIVRGHGYVAFSIIALIGLLRLARTQRYGYGILWGIAMGVATLFRIEGAAILLLAPLGLLVIGKHVSFLQKIRLLCSAYTVGLVISLALLVYVIVSHHINYLGRINEVITNLSHPFARITQVLQAATIAMQDTVLSPVAASGASTLLVGGVVVLTIIVFIRAMGWVYLLFSGYGLCKRVIADRAAMVLLTWLIIINIAIAAMFVLQMLFISKRYLLLLILLCLLWIPGAIAVVYRQWCERGAKRWLFPLVCVGFLTLTVGSLGHFGPAKGYLVKASRWLTTHRDVPLLITNSTKIHRLNEYEYQVIYPKIDSRYPLAPQLAKVYRKYRDKTAYFVIDVPTEQLSDVITIFPQPPIQQFDSRSDNVVIFANNM